ncbi:hypothetical protein M8818_007206 [Zalaria obscura]|uniref:Uncharacterized protein n=1 Tax=Zalaria obscura TaxID=2024903 RepID=A0ACC3S7A5_9PEZI
MRNSKKQPQLFTVTVDGLNSHTTPTSPVNDQSQWHLPAYDLRNEQRYLYKIHTVDLYFWTSNDATLFLESTRQAVSDQQLQYDVIVPPEHNDSMSPVVQQLEQAAISGPPQPRAGSTNTQGSFTGPTSAGAIASPQPQAPAPYNPAAPAAPEPIAHREKTPPPADAAAGTGLTAAAYQEHPAQYTTAPPLSQHPSYQQTPQTSYFPGPPSRNPSQSYGAPQIAGTPPQYQPTHTHSSFPPPPPGTSAPPHQQQQTPSFSAPPSSQPQAQYASYPPHQQPSYLQSPGLPLQSPGLPGPGTPSLPPAYHDHTPLASPGYASHSLTSPGFPPHSLASPGLPPPPPPPGQGQHAQQPQPLGGYSGYSYAQPQQMPSQSEAYGVHAQAYRPTEEEAAHGAKPGKQGPGVRPGGMEERLGKVEKGVGRFLKKLDSKW